MSEQSRQIISVNIAAMRTGAKVAERGGNPISANLMRCAADELEYLRTALAAEKEAADDLREAFVVLSAKLEKAKEALKDAEAVMTIVEPRNNKAEYLECLNVVRAAIRSAAKEV